MSLIRNTLALSALATLATAQTSTTPRLNAACADVVIFMARGNDAPYHDTRTSPFIDATCAKVKAEGKTCDYEDIEFDVTLGAPWCPQISEGAMNGIKQITDFNARCPCSHIVVNGYSEGANVVGDVLGGPSGCEFPSTGLDSNSKAGKAIAAALIWGDVRHTANQPYNVLDGADKGPYPRVGDSLERLNRYSSVLRSYCAAGDPICAGGKDVTQHLNYFELYTDAASSWAVGKVDAAAPLCGASSSSSSAAPTATASGSASSAPASTATASGSASSAPASSGAASATASGAASSAPVASTPASSAPASYPVATSPATVAPFPPAQPYPTDSCVVIYEVKYVYA